MDTDVAIPIVTKVREAAGKRGPVWRFETPAAFARPIDKYFKDTEADKVTYTGMCLALGIGKNTFRDYHKRKGYEDIVTMAKLRIEHAYEVALRERGGVGNIFALKNFGWVDNVSHEHSGNERNPLITKIVREVVNVKQIEHEPVNISQVIDDPTDDFGENSGFKDAYDDFLL